MSAVPAMNNLLSSPENSPVLERIAGFASLDYRLSPHPSFPQDPATTPAQEFRNALHPDHIQDIWTALSFLHSKYRIGDAGLPYVLCGHSVGATMGLQVIMGDEVLRADQDGKGDVESTPKHVPLPVAVVGFEGVYDLTGLNDRVGGAYTGLWSGAMGGDQKVWDQVSPAKFEGNFREQWSRQGSKGGLVVLAQSPEDELVDMQSLDDIERKLEADGQRVITFRDIHGTHDEVVSEGTYIARVVRQALEELDRASKHVHS
jgi:kynurenine formamidase